MTKKTLTKRLALTTETVRELRDGEMQAVAGASALGCLPPKSVGPYKCPPPPPHQM